MQKAMDVSPLCHKFTYKPWTLVEGSRRTGVFYTTPIILCFTACSDWSFMLNRTKPTKKGDLKFEFTTSF